MPTQQTQNIINQLVTEYESSVKRLQSALAAYLKDKTAPSADQRANNDFCYPELIITYAGKTRASKSNLAFGKLEKVGTFRTTFTKPDLFADYIGEQLDLLVEQYELDISVGRSSQEIPFPYVMDGSADLELGTISPNELARYFPTTELADIGDEIADGLLRVRGNRSSPLALFDGLRTDFSLARLRHYTGAPAEHVQHYILFTNYHRYVDEFVSWACKQVGNGRYTALSGAGGLYVDTPTDNAAQLVADSTWRRHQMPAYHLIAPDRSGITLVNIGVGPSNAKTICDHLAVLRPEAWLMIGHCGGLRETQRIGDYVLAHAYLRDDHILDDVLPPEIPIPPIAEVQQALASAAEYVSGTSGADLKRRMRTGTVVTTDDRNWELRYSASALRFSQSRAIAIDMESATIAAQGYRFRVPYGTLLCVSDKPLHGEIKLPGQANRFYEEAIAAHLQIGIQTCELLREAGNSLHSRKLRAFNEPPFR
ncbi:Pfs Nucleoside phosphorylase [Sphingomonadaceae bacterium]|jgi:AMP nucleosidase|uniref:AMP nucleosidase n=1 Tax=Sphingorhabdus sp. TaxID=1902408 RepID=UPI0027402615|nr:AMP nucleosidase [Sphingorhabdus sp.]MCF8492772.1 AMP nucleosidase [Sphingomonadaceae bacterium]MCF8497096.1 AMP nucleosidase [Sphingomonadaceae bacterium]MDP4874215.1 AMP nucleosidase [Sphingorhabdus sp.]MDP4927848.1 AMP nucleosidase [Sphingorhabdus sp.]